MEVCPGRHGGNTDSSPEPKAPKSPTVGLSTFVDVHAGMIIVLVMIFDGCISIGYSVFSLISTSDYSALKDEKFIKNIFNKVKHSNPEITVLGIFLISIVRISHRFRIFPQLVFQHISGTVQP